MSGFIAGVLWRQGTWWRLVGVCTIIFATLLPGPLIASADDGGKAEGQVSLHVTADLLITNGGTVDSSAFPTLRTTGEQIIGCVARSDWKLIGADYGCSQGYLVRQFIADAHPSLEVDHSSVTQIDPATGLISGDARGTFIMSDFKGHYQGRITAQMDATKTLAWIKDTGTWTARDKNGDKATGTFAISITRVGFFGPGNNNLPILFGSIELSGTHNKRDDQ